MYMIKSLALVACMVIFGSGCASNANNKAEQTSTSDELVASTEEANKDGIVCTYEKKLGKLIKEKICYSKRQRDIIDKAAEEVRQERTSKRR